jgi:hypothetical protein
MSRAEEWDIFVSQVMKTALHRYAPGLKMWIAQVHKKSDRVFHK